MGKLKPIGSEKLTGIDAINRMIEISNYNLNKPQPINETHSFDYKKTLADNYNYFIVKEKTGYVLKKGLTESTSEYIDPMKNRKFYPSYSQALKRLNLITKEVSSVEGYDKNISLFESDEEERFFLKTKELDEQGEQQQPAPQPQTQQPAPQPAQQQAPPPVAPEDEMGMGDEDFGDEPMGDEDMDMPEDGMEDEGGDEEVITFKVLQKYTGKLAQKVREFLSNEENQLSSEDVLYILNSIISALPIDNLEMEDKEKVMSKFEGGEQEYEIEVDDNEEDMGSDEMGDMGPEEMGDMGGEEMPTEPEVAEEAPFGRQVRNMRERQDFQRQSLYSESSIDKVLSGYFTPEKNNKTWSKVQKISESYEQENSSKKFLNKYPNAKLLGKNLKGDLVFEMYDEQFNITPKGQVI
jgi:hypothetical protein